MTANKSGIKDLRVWLYAFLTVVFVGVVYVSTDSSDGLKQRLALSWIFWILAIAFPLVFIGFFTQRLAGETDPDTKKVQSWIVFSYGFMFFSIFIAIWPFVGAKDVKLEEVEKKPISLFLLSCSEDVDEEHELACQRITKGKTEALGQKQWVINIGGWVRKCQLPVIGQELCVKGGLVVPLYFVVLALIGGAVSLTRRVPEYQKRSSPSYVGTEKEPKLDPPTAREYLVFQIVQFISAPFIAAVAYYLVSPETRTVGVALGFTSGFASEAILLMIRGVVEKVSPASERAPRTGAASGNVVGRAAHGAPVASARVVVVGQPNLTTETDARGDFVLDGIPVGEQVIEATDANRSVLAKLTIGAGKTSVCHIELP